MPRGPSFTPFTAGGRRSISAILLTLALSATVGVLLSIVSTAKSQHRAAVLEVAGRQRSLAERYVKEILLAEHREPADPRGFAAVMAASAQALLHGGTAPPVQGDDDASTLPPATDPVLRRQLGQEVRLVWDLTGTGAAILNERPVMDVPLRAGEHIETTDPIERLRILAALTSSVSLNAARTIAVESDRQVSEQIVMQVALGAGSLLISLLLAWALIGATRRQAAHFRSLVSSSTDLVMLFGHGGCRYVSASVVDMVGVPEEELLGDGYARHVHEEDLDVLQAAAASGEPRELMFRMANRFEEWRHLEAVTTDLRGDRHVRGVVLNARDITERVALEGELTRQAFHDNLTGLANRALFRDRLDHALARSERSSESVSLLLADLDGFKEVNDTLGHGAGDEMLQLVSQRFLESVRPADTVARLGGDEFGVLIEGADQTRATTVAKRLLESLADPISVAGRELDVGASIGVVVHPGGAGKGEDLMRHADVAMYAAKEAGRGRFEIFHHEMARDLGRQLGLEHEMRHGLGRGEFLVHYQPEVNLVSGRLVGMEALLRWTSPSRGSVPPSQFIPPAEASGVIMQLGDFVLREACRQTGEWGAQGLLPDEFVMWVNVSGKQLSAGGVVDLILQALAESDLPPTRLGIEVTETAIVADGSAGERAQAELGEIHARGIQIAIDDFGTGFSSLGQLRRFPIDVLKVDRSFVQGIEHDPKDAAITASLASLAHALGLVAVAEGIESKGQLVSARELGCDVAQGYLFARPGPPDDVVQYFHEPVSGEADGWSVADESLDAAGSIGR